MSYTAITFYGTLKTKAEYTGSQGTWSTAYKVMMNFLSLLVSDFMFLEFEKLPKEWSEITRYDESSCGRNICTSGRCSHLRVYPVWIMRLQRQ